jgi:toxin ParE1/3/4
MPRKTFEVRWSQAAARDLERIVSFIAYDSPVDARRVLARLRSLASRLASSPNRGRLVPEVAPLGMRRWRELIAAPYRLIYRVEGHRVYILGVFDGRRDLA